MLQYTGAVLFGAIYLWGLYKGTEYVLFWGSLRSSPTLGYFSVNYQGIASHRTIVQTKVLALWTRCGMENICLVLGFFFSPLLPLGSGEEPHVRLSSLTPKVERIP